MSIAAQPASKDIQTINKLVKQSKSVSHDTSVIIDRTVQDVFDKIDIKVVHGNEEDSRTQGAGTYPQGIEQLARRQPLDCRIHRKNHKEQDAEGYRYALLGKEQAEKAQGETGQVKLLVDIVYHNFLCRIHEQE